ncbi:hypothetical protein [Amycolatopsis orientalis]|uniref:hypothetical protein n=1 Tax=Amycolatopsis orientalis TaxID=31958 RepID=UPI00039CAF2E|nr:hypothetical protein [Amycolatopsis orientalis]
MNDAVLVFLVAVFAGAFAGLVLVRTAAAERAAGERGVRPPRSRLVRRLDLAAVVVTVLLVASVVLRVMNAVG